MGPLLSQMMPSNIPRSLLQCCQVSIFEIDAGANLHASTSMKPNRQSGASSMLSVQAPASRKCPWHQSFQPYPYQILLETLESHLPPSFHFRPALPRCPVGPPYAYGICVLQQPTHNTTTKTIGISHRWCAKLHPRAMHQLEQGHCCELQWSLARF